MPTQDLLLQRQLCSAATPHRNESGRTGRIRTGDNVADTDVNTGISNRASTNQALMDDDDDDMPGERKRYGHDKKAKAYGYGKAQARGLDKERRRGSDRASND